MSGPGSRERRPDPSRPRLRQQSPEPVVVVAGEEARHDVAPVRVAAPTHRSEAGDQDAVSDQAGHSAGEGAGQVPELITLVPIADRVEVEAVKAAGNAPRAPTQTTAAGTVAISGSRWFSTLPLLFQLSKTSILGK